MAKRHSSPILPFPPEIDRKHFASWFSGFADGEASFVLAATLRNHGTGNRTFCARFGIQLRADDGPILHRVQSFLGCGTVQHKSNAWATLKSKPGMEFLVARTADNVQKIIPHFHAFPLMAKKARDFIIWEQGVLLLWEVAHRKVFVSPKGSGKRPGYNSKWTTADGDRFEALRAALKAQRVYNAAAVELPTPRPPRPEPPSLFDALP